MNSCTYLGIDNGVTGSVGIITSENEIFYFHTPVKKCLNYTKKKAWINRIDYPALVALLKPHYSKDVFALLERPMINPMRFSASISAIRAFEATVLFLETFEIPYEIVDSRKWQKELLPSGLQKEELKIASLDVAHRLFPKVELKGFKDADGLLIAEYCRRIKNQG